MAPSEARSSDTGSDQILAWGIVMDASAKVAAAEGRLGGLPEWPVRRLSSLRQIFAPQDARCCGTRARCGRETRKLVTVNSRFVVSVDDFWDYPRALRELWDRSTYERGLISNPFGDTERARRGLDRMRALLERLDNPQARVPTIHVAGSKGKGSTAAFIAAAARFAGHHVGFYSSPHLHRFPERIALDGQPITDPAFAHIAQTVFAAARALESASPDLGSVTTFEFVTAMAFSAFAADGCDLAVIEVGLGGLYDATNVLTPLVSVITRIDLEHTAVLGNTYAEIASQKAGIIRPGIPCVSSPQVAAAAAAIEQVATEIGAQIKFGGRDWHWRGSWQSFDAIGPWGHWSNLSLALPGPHQVENACTAIAAIHVGNSAGVCVPEAAVRLGLAHTSWPARFERHHVAGRVIILDSAHTPAAARALVETWHGVGGATVVLGMGSDKDTEAFLSALRPIVERLVVTRADSPRAADPEAIAAVARSLGFEATSVPTIAAAMQNACQASTSPLLITGSLFVAGEGREFLGLADPDLEWRKLNAAPTSRANQA
jgi:dihydrofolate synthase/folylpolyglutamate synthase